jgi:hypothetical protein
MAGRRTHARTASSTGRSLLGRQGKFRHDAPQCFMPTASHGKPETATTTTHV